MNTITIKDATGNIICSVESSPTTVTTSPINKECDTLSKCSTECTKAVESLNALVTTYKVCSTEGFGDTAKMVAGKMQEKITKIKEFFKKIGEFISNKLINFMNQLSFRYLNSKRKIKISEKDIDPDKLNDYNAIGIFYDKYFDKMMLTTSVCMTEAKKYIADTTSVYTRISDEKYLVSEHVYSDACEDPVALKSAIVNLCNNNNWTITRLTALRNLYNDLQKLTKDGDKKIDIENKKWTIGDNIALDKFNIVIANIVDIERYVEISTEHQFKALAALNSFIKNDFDDVLYSKDNETSKNTNNA